jgi:hypothetical protein
MDEIVAILRERVVVTVPRLREMTKGRFASQCRIRRFGKSSSIGEVTNSDVERGWAMKPPCPFL